MEHVTEQQLTRRQSTVWRALRAAAPQTIPVLAGYFVLGMGYGIYVQSLGLPVWMPMLMGTVVYGGSLEFVLASLLLSAFSPLSAFLMALMIQARHLFYGLAMLERYKGYGLRSFYMIFAMSDETFSITCSAEPPEGVDRGWFMFFITLLDQSVAMDALQSRLGLGLEEANRQYGEYAFALTLFSLPPSFLYPISVSLVPAISGALGQGDRRTARRHTRTALRMALLLALPSGIGLSVLAGPVLRLLYPAQVQTAAAAAHHLRVLGLAAVCVCLMVVSGGILQAWGHEHIPVVTLLTGGAVKISVSYQLVSDPAWGIRGAAVGTLLCYALIAGMNLLAVGRTTGIVFRWGVPLRTLVAVGAMAVTASGFYRMLVHRASLPLAVLGAVAAAAAVYGGLVLLLGAVRREELCAVFAAKKRRKPSGFF